MKSLILFVMLGLVSCSVLGVPAPSSVTAIPSAVIAVTRSPDISTAGPTEQPPPTTPEPQPTVSRDVDSFPEVAGFGWLRVAEGLDRPLGLANAGDDRLFVLEQRGVVKVLQGGRLLELPYLDLRSVVNSSGNEQGLLGLAFHPQYEFNGLAYVNYTDAQGNTVVARYAASTDHSQANLDSAAVLLQIEQPYANHNGGALAFDPQGHLFVATGDGGSGGDPHGNGQRLDTLLGKLLRLGVDAAEPYSIPADNPFAAGGGRPEIWAYGLRNPWRLAFDRATGDLLIGDVGQDSWEEVDFWPAEAPGGANFGWNIREGLHPYAGGSTVGLTDPVVEYGHELGCSITGGVVVRSPSLPEWRGVYLYGDYCSGRIWGLLRNGQGEWTHELLFITDFQITSFGEDALGEVYVVDQNGGVYRLERNH